MRKYIIVSVDKLHFGVYMYNRLILYSRSNDLYESLYPSCYIKKKKLAKSISKGIHKRYWIST